MKFHNSSVPVLLALLLSTVIVSPVKADHLLPSYPLQCSNNFPCPDEIKRRVDFWVHVFLEWDKTKAILHDPDSPERVYTVLDTGKGCSAHGTIKRERRKLRANLEDIATKRAKGQKISGSYRQHLARLFKNRSARQIRSSAKNIRCQSGVRNGFVAGLKRFQHYSGMVDAVISKAGLPEELRYLPFVESSYNPAAYSKAGAAGMWQIMPKTARVLGLELNATIDERLDPEAATRAAALYFQRSTKSLNTLSREIDPGVRQSEINPFIVTSYNYGVNGMRRAIRKHGPDYLQVLNKYKSPSFQVAVKNFYASFLAAIHLAKNADKYFGNLSANQTGTYTTVLLKNNTSMERIKNVFGETEARLKPLNPALTRFVWNGWRLIPAGYQLKLPSRQGGWAAAVARLAVLPAETVVPGSDSYKVRRGDTACGIARALGVNCRELIKVNRLNKKATIRIGQKLIIPRQVVVQTVTDSTTKAELQSRKQSIEKQKSATTYRVRRGDSACKIAEKFGVSCRELIKANSLGRSAKILIGQRLTIPGDAVSQSTRAGLNENNRYIVRKGDSACAIARRYGVSCVALRNANSLNQRAVIFPGQKLDIPGLQLPDTSETVEQLVEQAGVDLQAQSSTVQKSDPVLVNLLDTLPDLSVAVGNLSGKPVYTIRVEADETVGHFADWLNLRSSSVIRKLNRLGSGRALVIGKRLVLPIDDANQLVRFEKKRSEYHQVLSESLKENYVLAGISQYRVQSGDSLWQLSSSKGFPLWLIYRMNPILRSTRIKPGQMIKLPVLVKR
ncbi:MAG: LysM peptidoglycan-binding domain-containing protein [Pseudomonadota bacterium]